MRRLPFLFLALLFLFPLALNAQTVPTNGLVAHYPFNGDATDASGHGNDGELGGTSLPTLTTDRFGNPNSAYLFGGVDAPSWIRVAKSGSLAFSKSFSVSCWISHTSFTGLLPLYGDIQYGNDGSEQHMIISRGGTGFYDAEYFVPFSNSGLFISSSPSATNNNVTFQYGNSDEEYNPNQSLSSVVNCYEPNEWIHIVVTVADQRTRLYINGVLYDESSQDDPDFASANDQDLYIGRCQYPDFITEYFEPSIFPFYGKIDDIAIYNRALTDSEIKGLYGNYADGAAADNHVTVDNVSVQNPCGLHLGEVTLSAQGSGIQYALDSRNNIQPSSAIKAQVGEHRFFAMNSCGAYDTVITLTCSCSEIPRSISYDTVCPGDAGSRGSVVTCFDGTTDGGLGGWTTDPDGFWMPGTYEENYELSGIDYPVYFCASGKAYYCPTCFSPNELTDTRSELFTPAVSVVDPARATLSFKYIAVAMQVNNGMMVSTGYNTLSLAYSTSTSGPWTTIWNSGGGDVDADPWPTASISLALLPSGGTYYFRFLNVGNGYVTAVDDFVVTEDRRVYIPDVVTAADEGSTVEFNDTLHLAGFCDSIVTTYWYVRDNCHQVVEHHIYDSVCQGTTGATGEIVTNFDGTGNIRIQGWMADQGWGIESHETNYVDCGQISPGYFADGEGFFHPTCFSPYALSNHTSHLYSPVIHIDNPARTTISFDYVAVGMEIGYGGSFQYGFNTLILEYAPSMDGPWSLLYSSGGDDIDPWLHVEGLLSVIPQGGDYYFRFTSTGNGYVTAMDNFKIVEDSRVSIPAEVTNAAEGATVDISDTVHIAGFGDSIVIKHWYIYNNAHGYDTVETANSYTWNGQTYDASGDYSKTGFQSAQGCDSTAHLHLVLASNTQGDTFAVACDSFLWYGRRFTATDTAQRHLANVAGADSTVILHLTIHHPYQNDTTAGACLSYRWRGNTYTESQTVVDSAKKAGNCDSIVTLNLSIYQTTESFDTVIIPEHYTWNGTEYTESGDYTKTGLHNVHGCDSTAHLNLTLSVNNGSDTLVNACDSFVWYGRRFTASDTAQRHYTNIWLGDSTVTLHVNIYHPHHSDTTAVACVEYDWRGTHFSATQDFADSNVKAGGCDSVVTLHLTINPADSLPTVARACDTFRWIGNNTVYDSSAREHLRFTNRFGCDSVMTLDLTVNYTTRSIAEVSGCDSRVFNGHTYSATSIDTNIIRNVAGCDSLILTTVTVLQTPVLTLTSDTTIAQCTTLQLQATGAERYIWTPAADLSSDTVSNPTLRPSANNYYVVAGYVTGINLIRNGNFEQGATGFQTSYQKNENLSAEQTYNVGTSASQFLATFPDVRDHTTGTGNYMVVNGSNRSGTAVWKQVVDVTPSTFYTFSLAATNLSATAAANLLVSINSENFTETFPLTASVGQWQQFSQRWYSGNAHQATIIITDITSDITGNDFGIDDISFRPYDCISRDTVNVKVDFDTIHEQVCDSYTWPETGITYGHAGFYNVHYTTSTGCDSIKTLDLQLNYNETVTTVDSACRRYTWSFNGRTYTESNIYRDTVVTDEGCHRFGILDLNILGCTEPALPDNVDSVRCMMVQEASDWSIRLDWSSDRIVSNHNTPFVGDLDGDGNPEVVCFGKASETTAPFKVVQILVFDVINHQLKRSITMPQMVTSYDASAYGLVKLPNGKGLIVVASCDMKLRAFDITSPNADALYWTSDEDYGTTGQFAVNLFFADLDNDGNPEICVRDRVYDAATGVLLAKATGGRNTGSSYSHYSHSTGHNLSSPIAANIVGDARQEIILGNEIYDVNITNHYGTAGNSVTLLRSIEPPAGVVWDGNPQIADFDLDGHSDILITNKSSSGRGGYVSMYVWDVFRDRVSDPVRINTDMSGKSIPLIADMDNDDNLEVTIQCAASGVGDKRVRTYKFNARTFQFEFMWGFSVDEDSYSNGMTAFDFNLDGQNEMLICDQSRIRVVNGRGETMNTFPFAETTIMQYPVIADVDNDGHAEIISVGSNSLNIFKSSGQPWAPARSVWNQYVYNVLNVNEDLTVPTQSFSNATLFVDPFDQSVRRPFNNCLQQATSIDEYGRPYYTAVDLEADSVVVDTALVNDSVHFTLYYHNYGSQRLPAGNPITIYRSHYHGANLLTVTQTPALARGEGAALRLALPASLFCHSHDSLVIALNNRGRAMAQGDGLEIECDTTNNTIKMGVPPYVAPADTMYAVACDSYIWQANGMEYRASCHAFDTLLRQAPAALGCDSILFLELAINRSNRVTMDTMACDGYLWPATDSTYVQSTHLSRTTTNRFGCDSTNVLNLVVHYSSNRDTNVVACNMYYWPVDRRVYEQSIIQRQHLLSQYGCDSTVTLNLIVYHTAYDTVTATICPGGSLSFFGQNLTREGRYVFNTAASTGCDSVVVLDLSVRKQLRPMFDSVHDCKLLHTTLTVTNDVDSNTTFSWSSYPFDDAIVPFTQDSSIVVNPALTTLYTLTLRYRDQPSCPASRSFNATTIRPVTAVINPSSKCFTPDIDRIHLYSNGQGASTIAWFADGWFFSNQSATEYDLAPDADSVNISLIAFNNRCSDTARIVLYRMGGSLFVPNLFTPSEERTTTFRVWGADIASYEIFIYNRKGLLVYHSTELDNGWDGFLPNGTKAPMGGYAYLIRYSTIATPTKVQIRRGVVTLAR